MFALGKRAIVTVGISIGLMLNPASANATGKSGAGGSLVDVSIYDTGRNLIPTYASKREGTAGVVLQGTLVDYRIAKSADPERIDVAWLVVVPKDRRLSPIMIRALLPLNIR